MKVKDIQLYLGFICKRLINSTHPLPTPANQRGKKNVDFGKYELSAQERYWCAVDCFGFFFWGFCGSFFPPTSTRQFIEKTLKQSVEHDCSGSSAVCTYPLQPILGVNTGKWNVMCFQHGEIVLPLRISVFLQQICNYHESRPLHFLHSHCLT